MEDSGADAEKTRTLIESGGAILGPAIGAVVGLPFGPPGVVGGAAAGGFLSQLVNRLGADFFDRQLSTRQRARVGAATGFALLRIDKNEREGHSLRDDGFFSSDVAQPSSGRDILEGVLVSAADCYEERKVPFLGNLLGNVPYSHVSPGDAHLVLTETRSMTFRQLAALACIGRRSEFDLREVPYEYYNLDYDQLGLLSELYELVQLGFLAQFSPAENQHVVIQNGREVVPGDLMLDGLGVMAFNLMSLEEMINHEIAALIETPLGQASAESSGADGRGMR